MYFFFMQKSFVSWIIAWVVITLVSISTVAHAANGGLFGDILAKILGITPAQVLSYTGDGTVANANALSGMTADKFQKVNPGQSCGGGKCVAGFDTSWNVICR
jgi:hypothetical protein